MMRRYPHEVSGGEKQRVVIATAFACRPDLIIFDEPTTALDVITGARILELFADCATRPALPALYISHDLALVSRVADRVAVIEARPPRRTGPGCGDFWRTAPCRDARPRGRRAAARTPPRR